MLYITSESARCKTRIGYYVCWDEKNISLLGNNPDCSRLQSTFERCKNRHLPTNSERKNISSSFKPKLAVVDSKNDYQRLSRSVPELPPKLIADLLDYSIDIQSA